MIGPDEVNGVHTFMGLIGSTIAFQSIYWLVIGASKITASLRRSLS